MNIDQVFTWECEARDHEIDFQGRVHNTYYLVYMEHARYKHCQYLGFDIRDTQKYDFDIVLVRAEIDFKASIMAGDEFIVTSKVAMMGKIRLVFEQEIIRKRDNKVMAQAKNTIACINRNSGRPIMPDELKLILNVK